MQKALLIGVRKNNYFYALANFNMKIIKYIVYFVASILLFIVLSLGATNLYYYLISFVSNFFLVIISILFGTFFFVEIINLFATLMFMPIKRLNLYGNGGILIVGICILLIGLILIIINFINTNFEAKNSILYFIGFLMTYGGCVGKYFQLLNVDNELKRWRYNS